MGPKLKLLVAIAALVAYVGAALALFVIEVWSGLRAGERTVVERILADHVAFAVVLGVLFVVGLGLQLAVLFRAYVAAANRLAEETRIISSVNPGHRIDPSGGAELRELAAAVNELARRHETAERELERRLEAESADLRAERDRLAAVIAGLPQGLLVCDGEGRILLYNEAARALLGCEGEDEMGGPVGLGRSVFGIVDRDVLAHALETVRGRVARGSSERVSHLATTPIDGRPVRLELTPFPAPDGDSLDSFVVSVEPVLDRDGWAVEPQVVRSRPVFFDFDLFATARRRPEWDELLLPELVYTAFDVEATGLDPSGGDEIVALGAIRIAGGRLLEHETFDRLVDPKRPISLDALGVHGISPWMLEGKPTIEDVLPEFARFADDSVLLGHNVAFDLRFLELLEERTGIRFIHPVLDTLLLSTVLHPTQEDHSLEALTRRLGVSLLGRHTALGDAILAGEIFLRLIPLLAQEGVLTLEQALEASRQTDLARVAY